MNYCFIFRAKLRGGTAERGKYASWYRAKSAVLLIATVGQRYRNKLIYRNKNHRKQRSNSLTLKVRYEIRLRIAIKNVASACKKMNVLACARVSRFSFFAFTASPVWRFSFIHRGLWVKVFAKKASPFVYRRHPFEGMHTHRANGRRKTGARD